MNSIIITRITVARSVTSFVIPSNFSTPKQYAVSLNIGDKCEKGSQLRPHIVWFGEEVPMLEKAAGIVSLSDIVLVVGTSMQVYPAAGLVGIAPKFAPIIYVDPKPSLNYEMKMTKNLVLIHVGHPFVTEPLTIETFKGCK